MKYSTKKSKGQSLAEFALTIPVMLLLVFTFFDFGRAIYYYSALSNAVREGARHAIVINNTDRSHDSDIKDFVSHFSVAVQVDPNRVNITYSGDDNEFITILAEYDFSPVTPFLARLLSGGNSLTLTTDTTMMLSPIAH